jgi:hypothetical protein
MIKRHSKMKITTCTPLHVIHVCWAAGESIPGNVLRGKRAIVLNPDEVMRRIRKAWKIHTAAKLERFTVTVSGVSLNVLWRMRVADTSQMKV